MPRRKYRLIETRMVSEWMASVYPDCRKVIRTWLGPTGKSDQLDRAGVTQRVLLPFGGGWVDAIIFGPDWTRLVEACVVSDTRHVGQLEGYVRLFRETEEYLDRWDMAVIPVLLYAYPRTLALRMARDKGYETIRYAPDYIRAYYHETVGIVPGR